MQLRLAARFPVSVHGLGFGKGADLDMLRLVSAGSGGQAQRIFDDADMDTQVQLFFEAVSAPQMVDVSFTYTAMSDASCTTSSCAVSCALDPDDAMPGGKCRLAAQPETSLYRGSTLVHAGQLPIIGASRAQALKVSVRGLGFVPADAPSRVPEYAYRSQTHVFGLSDGAAAGVLTGAEAPSVRKLWAHLAVSAALDACPLYASSRVQPSWPPPPSPNGLEAGVNEYGEDAQFPRDRGCAYGFKGGRTGLLALAKAAALDAKIVTPFTSMVVVTTRLSASGLSARRAAGANCSLSAAAGGCNSTNSTVTQECVLLL
eukprot:Tamp_12277.p1 GENE.Tamp_12277~~Tamp_12277.p1  ORF type:complete len:316 (-),score=37.56 Tamp_12277:275-1222(-)